MDWLMWGPLKNLFGKNSSSSIGIGADCFDEGIVDAGGSLESSAQPLVPGQHLPVRNDSEGSVDPLGKVLQMFLGGVRVAEHCFKAETVSIPGARKHESIVQQLPSGALAPVAGLFGIHARGMKSLKVQITLQQGDPLPIQPIGKRAVSLQCFGQDRFDSLLAELTEAEPQL